MADDLRRLAEAVAAAWKLWNATPSGYVIRADGTVGDSAEYGRLRTALAAAVHDFAVGVKHEEVLALYARLDAQAARIAALEAAGKVVVDTWGRFDDPHTRCTEAPCLFCGTVAALARALEGR